MLRGREYLPAGEGLVLTGSAVFKPNTVLSNHRYDLGQPQSSSSPQPVPVSPVRVVLLHLHPPIPSEQSILPSPGSCPVMHPAGLCIHMFTQIKRILVLLPITFSSGLALITHHSNHRAGCRQVPKRCRVDSEAPADSAHKMGHYCSCFSYTTPV